MVRHAFIGPQLRGPTRKDRRMTERVLGPGAKGPIQAPADEVVETPVEAVDVDVDDEEDE